MWSRDGLRRGFRACARRAAHRYRRRDVDRQLWRPAGCRRAWTKIAIINLQAALTYLDRALWEMVWNATATPSGAVDTCFPLDRYCDAPTSAFDPMRTLTQTAQAPSLGYSRPITSSQPAAHIGPVRMGVGNSNATGLGNGRKRYALRALLRSTIAAHRTNCRALDMRLSSKHS